MAASNAGREVLCVSFDYGTMTLEAAFHIRIPGQALDEADITDVPFKGKDTISPQKIAFDNGVFYWGHELETMLDCGEIEHDKVIMFLKAAFYKGHATSSMVKHTMKQVELLKPALFPHNADKDLYDAKILVLAKHIEEVMEHVIQYAEQTLETGLRYEEGMIREMPKELFISVPGMWLPPGNRSIIEAVKLAGISRVELNFESQVAAASWAHSLIPRATARYQAGDEILILDAGGLTSDLSRCRLQTDSNTGVQLQFKAVQESLGDLCGSEFINQEFLQWLDEEIERLGDNKQDLLKLLKCSELEFASKASTSFGWYKENFNPRSTAQRLVRVAGNIGAASKEYTVEITSEQMRTFFEPVFQNNFDLIRRRLSPAVKALVVVGGLSDSAYFMNRLREEFNAKDIKIECGGIRAIGRGCNPVTRGTLLKYAGKETRDLPITDSFGISEDQVYEFDKHPDLEQLFGDQRDAPRNRPQRRQARSSQFYSDKYAKARWRTIVPEGPRTRQTLWQLRCVPVLAEEKDFLMQVFWSANQRPENCPIFTTNDGDQLRDGIERFGTPLRIMLPDLAQEGFPWKQPDRMPGKKLKEWFPGYCRTCRIRKAPLALKKEHICWTCAEAEFYEVYYRLELTFSGANIYYRVEFAKPEKNDAIASGVQLGRDDVIRLGEKQLLISEHQNPNPRV